MLRRSNFTKTVIPLVMLVLVLAPGVAGWEQAGAQETVSRERTTTRERVPEPPELDLEAWILTDLGSELYLTGENPDEQLPIASMAKIMSALVVLEELEEGGVDLDEEVTISEEAESYVGTTYSNVGLIQGERLTIRDLLKAALIPSGTDAVYALAEYLGYGSVDDFVDRMNDKAASMGLENTNFETPAGLDTTGNYSSAQDLATMARAALQYPLFAEIVLTRDDTISTQNREIEIHSTNQLLTTYPKATGVKTGTSPQAGANLTASAEDGDESYIAVILGAEDDVERFQGAQRILEYGFNRYERRPLVRQDEVYGEVPLPYRRGETTELTAEEDITAPVDRDTEPERRVTTEELPPSAEAGQRLGEVEVFVDGQSVGRSPLVAREGYAEASLWDKAWYAVGSAFEWVKGIFG
ncbi:MAG TPA: D-alanyl-D-alanine carboxypeptidase family protein [Rubrobacteraceae bacterium]|nr:D-alanyl-D-alanine carboxypeptidase family protein [Rubrobacteraceae bacterium]